ncbi:MAG TPA: hypothetical protein VJH22_03405 [Candidatus Nanoarchaeia archaeon]|nr:hypothetical protein [Candidatus Nanoarchaeia archaeon]
MDSLHYVAISGVAAIVIIIAAVALLSFSSENSTGMFQTGPTLKDTRGACIPMGETGCNLPGAVDCCAPYECQTRIGRAYIQYGVCRITPTLA